MVRNGQLSELKDAGTVLEIILPCDTSRSITVARCHADGNGQAQAMLLTQSTTGAEGTFYVDREGQCIHIFASKFSTYAIGYGRTSNSGHVPDDGEKDLPHYRRCGPAGLWHSGAGQLYRYGAAAAPPQARGLNRRTKQSRRPEHRSRCPGRLPFRSLSQMRFDFCGTFCYIAGRASEPQYSVIRAGSRRIPP